MTQSILRLFRRALDHLARRLYRFPRLERLVFSLRRQMGKGARLLMPWAFNVELKQVASVMADARPQTEESCEVLFMSFRAWRSHTAWDLTMAQALRLRGAESRFFFCGGGLPICEMGWPAEQQNRPCVQCGSYVAKMIEASRFSSIHLDQLVPGEERDVRLSEARQACRDEADSLEIDGTDLMPLIQQSLVWFFRTETLPPTAEVERARCDFLGGAVLMALAAGRLFERIRPKVIVMVNGLFYEERIVREMASARGIRVVSYEVGAQKGTLFFSGESAIPAADYDISDLWGAESDGDLSEGEEAELDRILADRAAGTSLPLQLHSRSTAFQGKGERRLVALFTNVSWDTAVTGRSYAFSSLREWVYESIRLAERAPHIDLVIRIHPGEAPLAAGRPHEKLASLIDEEFPILPENVHVIPPHDSTSSYSLMDVADLVCVFSSTVGLEAAAMGKPVCVVGKTHYRGKGFTLDVESRGEYAEVFEGRKTPQAFHVDRSRARKYAFLFFRRAMLPFNPVVHAQPGEPAFAFSRVADLAEGNDPVLDLICEGILSGSPFRLSSKRAP